MSDDGQFDYQTVRNVLARRIGEAILETAELEAALLTERARHATERQERADRDQQSRPDGE